ncbi:unnamed protein product [Prunus brigantina]
MRQSETYAKELPTICSMGSSKELPHVSEESNYAKEDFLSPPAPVQFRVEEWPCISVLSVRLILVSTGEVLEDSKSLADLKVENDAVVALTLRKDDNEFEEVNIVRADDFYQSRDADAGNW